MTLQNKLKDTPSAPIFRKIPDHPPETVKESAKKSEKKPVSVWGDTGDSAFAVYTFRQKANGQWRLRTTKSRKRAVTCAKALYKTGKYQRVEVKKILGRVTRENTDLPAPGETGQRNEDGTDARSKRWQHAGVKTVKILHQGNERVLLYMSAVLLSLAFAGLILFTALMGAGW